MSGRKRLLAVDTGGLLLRVVVHPASVQDRDGAKLVLAQLALGGFARLQLLWADGGYAGQLVDWVQERWRWALAIVKRAEGATGFVVLPKRWIVERTFAWLDRYRRLRQGYEYLPATAEAMIYAAMIHLMVCRLARK